MRKHFAFVSMPAYGHVNPSLALVEELVRRGHRVSYATGSDMVPAVRAAGAEPVPVPMEQPSAPAGDGALTPEAMAPMMEKFLEDTRETLPKLAEHFADEHVDAVCADSATPAGRVFAKKLGVPNISLVPTHAGNEEFSMRAEFLKRAPEDFDQNHPVLRDFTERMSELAVQQGVELDSESMMAEPAGALNLVFIPREFQFHADSFDERFAFLGPLLGGRAEREQWQPRRSDRPLLFVSLGTIFHGHLEFYRTCIEAFADTGWQVAMSIGNRVGPEELGEIPENFEVRARFPQTAVLRHADVFLSHAGMNSTMESLSYGVPLITAPRMVEQEMNAERVRELNLGGQLVEGELTDAARLRERIEEVAADGEITKAVGEMAETISGYGGARAGVDAIEAYLGAD
ncbi:glycosyltransferase, MGT family [Actinopolyspora saharensis]|uniref:Glycosyltransferase, MGT family n=2 Tax=Actinopolyspora saharensis TaxID=995062 RepID=A0A1H1ELY6_9ACTN|nr:glycosyltransferase, MGT family [Actinopolyspora saharensis]